MRKCKRDCMLVIPGMRSHSRLLRNLKISITPHKLRSGKQSATAPSKISATAQYEFVLNGVGGFFDVGCLKRDSSFDFMRREDSLKSDLLGVSLNHLHGLCKDKYCAICQFVFGTINFQKPKPMTREIRKPRIKILNPALPSFSPIRVPHA
jgi:hypothetical protein